MNDKCPGTSSKLAGKSDACGGCPNKKFCSEERTTDPDIEKIKQNISTVKLSLAIISGKGGVGKSTISRNLSETFSKCKFNTLLIDFDISGPSIPRLTNTQDELVYESNNVIYPIKVCDKFYCISVGHFLTNNNAFNSKFKNDVIKKILREICLTNIDVLIFDTPPGVGDEHLGLLNYVKIDFAIMVTTPQKISVNDVVRQIDFCRKAGIKIFGLIENMNGYECIECGHINRIFGGLGLEEICIKNEIKYNND